MADRHEPVTTLEDLDVLDRAEMREGYMSAERDDPEPGMNHTRSYHHGWRVRMFDLHAMEIPADHQHLAHLVANRDRGFCLRHSRRQSCRWCGAAPVGRGGGGKDG